MYPEVASAASHVTSLLHSKPASTEAFKSTLAGSLQTRCAKSWYTDDPQRGSATRVLHWQPGPGGEGCSSPLLKACKQFNASFGPAEWTLWVDPGCVAIRDGPGPGRTAATSFHFAGPTVGRQDAVRVLYGASPSPRPVAKAPQFDFVPAASIHRAPVICRPATLQPHLAPHAAATSGRVPSVTVSPSTPAVDADATPAATPMLPWTRDHDGEGSLGLSSQLVWRTRRFSDSSSSSSSSSSPRSAASVAYSNLSMDRGLSADTASSAGTSIPASSPPASASWEKLNFEDHEQQEGNDTPACSSAPFSGSDAAPPAAEFRFGTAETELRGLGLEDLQLDEELGPDDAPDSFQEDDRHDEGDDTLRPLEQSDDAADETAKVFELAAAKAATELSADHKKSHSRTSSTVTSFDNGNVGVLGGGVKLGGSSSASSAGRSRAHSNASNVSAISSAVGSGNSRGLHRGHKSRSSINARTGGWAQQQQQQHAQQNMLGLSGVHQPQQYQPASHTYLLPGNNAYPHTYEFQPQAEVLQQRLDQVARGNAHQREASSSEGYVPEFPPLPTEPLSKRRDLNPPLPPLGLSKQASNNALKPKSLNALKTASSNSLSTPKLSVEQDLPSPADSSASSYMSSQGDTDENAGYDDEGDENDPEAAGGANGTKRHRTRGRRSRGRGRTARRAAAAAAAAAAANGILSPPGLPSPHLLGQSWSTACPSPLMNGSGNGTPTMHHYQQPQFAAGPMTSPHLGQLGHHRGPFVQGHHHPQPFMPSMAAQGHYQPQPSAHLKGFPLGPAPQQQQQQRSFQPPPSRNGGLGIGLAW